MELDTAFWREIELIETTFGGVVLRDVLTGLDENSHTEPGPLSLPQEGTECIALRIRKRTHNQPHL